MARTYFANSCVFYRRKTARLKGSLYTDERTSSMEHAKALAFKLAALLQG